MPAFDRPLLEEWGNQTMKHGVFGGVLLMAGVMAASAAGGDSLAGRYVAEDEPALSLALDEAADGGVTGTLSDGQSTVSLSARRQGAGFVGTAVAGAQTLPTAALVEGDRLLLEIGAPGMAQRTVFRRDQGGHGGASPSASDTTAGQRNVVINGQRLSDEELARAEQAYRIRIPDAGYWYDPVLGAWGPQGGPTMGFIAPGLRLGGALQPDASGGGTAVVVNGRVLHPYDLMALQQITGPIVPGRYFITAQGLAGPEGGPPLWNLAAMAAQAQGTGGGSNTWQSRVTGASGFSDGTTGAVFLPNGGIVSTGQ
jgi:hypothetical protein